MIKDEIIYCIDDHSYKCYKFKTGQKYILKIFMDSNYRAIHDNNDNFLMFFFDNESYNFDRLNYFMSENEYRKIKLNKLNNYVFKNFFK